MHLEDVLRKIYRPIVITSFIGRLPLFPCGSSNTSNSMAPGCLRVGAVHRIKRRYIQKAFARALVGYLRPDPGIGIGRYGTKPGDQRALVDPSLPRQKVRRI